MTLRSPLGVLVFVVGAWLAGASGPVRAAEPAAVARQVDALLREEIPFVDSAGPQRISDEAFLRRATLDCIGRLPTPVQITTFVLDPAPDKRDRLVEGLLADSRYGTNWGRYWRDVIMYRKTEERQQFLVGIPLESYLADSLNDNKPWSQIATEFITATGGANSNGACGLIVAQQGQPEEIVGEVSRIFLGVQIQCAQCHDHPTDRWTREQFHQLAAFFPRVASQPSRLSRIVWVAVGAPSAPECPQAPLPVMVKSPVLRSWNSRPMKFPRTCTALPICSCANGAAMFA